MTDREKHTPTPWKLGHEQGGWVDIDAPDSNWQSLARAVVEMDGQPYLRGQANAEFIVRAVNNFDALVEALKRLLGATQCCYTGREAEINEREAVSQAREILAKIKVQP